MVEARAWGVGEVTVDEPVCQRVEVQITVIVQVVLGTHFRAAQPRLRPQAGAALHERFVLISVSLHHRLIVTSVLACGQKRARRVPCLGCCGLDHGVEEGVIADNS